MSKIISTSRRIIGSLEITNAMLAGSISDDKISSAATWNAKAPLASPSFTTGISVTGTLAELLNSSTQQMVFNRLDVTGAGTGSYGLLVGSNTDMRYIGSAASDAVVISVYSVLSHEGSGTVEQMEVFDGDVENTSTGTINLSAAVNAATNNLAGGTIVDAYGGILKSSNLGTGIITTATGLRVGVYNFVNGTIGTSRGIFVDAPYNPSGTVTNNYGIYISDQSSVGSTNSFNLYSVGANSKNYFGGVIKIAGGNPGAGKVLTSDADGDATWETPSGSDATKLPLAGGTLTGNLLATDNLYDIGQPGATRFRTGYFGTSIFSPIHYGGTAANDDVTIEGTSHATKTTSYVRLQPNGGFVGIGTATPASLLNVVSQDGSTSNVAFFEMYSGDATGAGSVWRKARGTLASPAGINSGDVIGFFGYRGYRGGGFGFHASSSAYIQVSASENFTGVNNIGADIIFGTSANASGTNAVRMTISNSGNVAIGTQTPTAVLHLKAGTATASTAPLKFNSGTLLTTAEAGAVEFLTDAYYATTTTGAKRRMLVAGTTGRSAAQTAAVGSVATYTLGAADASYEISANVLVTTSSAEAFTVTCAYTDEGNTARTITLPFIILAGTTVAAINFANGAVPYEGIVVHIRCKASTAITIATTGTFTGATYNVEGVIKQIA